MHTWLDEPLLMEPSQKYPLLPTQLSLSTPNPSIRSPSPLSSLLPLLQGVFAHLPSPFNISLRIGTPL